MPRIFDEDTGQSVSVLAASGGALITAPWQFRPETYGAMGDGAVASDVVTTNTSAVVVSPTIAADPKAVGKWIMIHGATGNGNGNGPLVTTILSVSGNNVTLGAAATFSATCPAVWGTDDTLAIKNAVAAAGAYGIANNFFGEVLFKANIYVLASGPTKVGDGSTVPTFNSQVPIPYPNPNGTTQKLVIALTGAGDGSYFQYWMSTTPNVSGTALVSMVSSPNVADATFGQQSVIGGPTGSAGFSSGLGTPFANVKLVTKGIAVWTPMFTNMIACDSRYLSGHRAQQCSAQTFAPTGVNGGAGPYLKDNYTWISNNRISVGFFTPVNQNNAEIYFDDVNVEGYNWAYRVSDHFTAGRIGCIYNGIALDIGLGGGTQHGCIIQCFIAEVYYGGVKTEGGGGTTIWCDINMLAECAPSTVLYDLNDAGNMLRGYFNFRDPADARVPIVSAGAANVKFIWHENVPGAVTASSQYSGGTNTPAVPATTVNFQNTFWRDAAVTISGGTVTAITVDGVATGLTSGTVIVPSNKNINITYSAAPAWKWVLL